MEKSVKKQQKMEEKKNKKEKKKKNHELAVVTYLFVGLFACLIGYVVYFDAVISEDVINNPYNSRQDTFADRVVRGEIQADDGTVLAETIVASDGTESRNYPYGKMFAHAVGYSTNGKTGIESIGNFNLLTSNAFFMERFSNEIKEEKNIGDNVITTLNLNLQKAAYDALGNYQGAVIAIEPDTGKVLAMVSKPDYDPNQIAALWDTLSTEKEESSALFNRATQGLYPPGSTFKIVTLLEYMRENENFEEFTYDCTGSNSVEGYTINCYDNNAHGVESLRKAFAKSCNSAFAQIGLSLDVKSYINTCDSLLFNEEIPISLPYSKSSFALTTDATDAQKMMTAVGQGETVVSPMHMALLTCAIANDGVLMKPYLIDHTESYTGSTIKTYRPSAYGTIMTLNEADTLSEYMQEVVTSGTGSKLSDLGVSIAGKTGTAEYSSDKSKSHAWFVGYSNIEAPELAVCVIVEEAGAGSEYAVPIAKKVFETYYSMK